MIALFDRLAAPLLRTLDPEQAHALALRALKLAPLPRPAADDDKLGVAAFGLSFPIRSALRPASTRMPKWSTRCSGSASALSRPAA